MDGQREIRQVVEDPLTREQRAPADAGATWWRLLETERLFFFTQSEWSVTSHRSVRARPLNGLTMTDTAR